MFTIARKILGVYNDNAKFTYYDKIIVITAVLFIVVSLNLDLFWDMIKTFWFNSFMAKVLIAGVLIFVSYQALNAVYGVLSAFRDVFLRLLHKLNRILSFIKRILVYASYVTIFYFVYNWGLLSKSIEAYNNIMLRIEAFRLVESIPETITNETVSTQTTQTHSSGVDYKDAYEGVLLQLEQEKQRLQRVLEVKQDTAMQNYKVPVVPLSSANSSFVWTMLE